MNYNIYFNKDSNEARPIDSENIYKKIISNSINRQLIRLSYIRNQNKNFLQYWSFLHRMTGFIIRLKLY